MEHKENVLERFRLDGKTAVVTGGAGNIGYHTAVAFAQAGASIALVDLPQCIERAEAAAKTLAETYGVRAIACGVDLVDDKAVAAMFDQVEKELGSVDIVHNNAGVGGALAPDIEEWDSEHNMSHLAHWRQVLDINLVSQYIVATEAARVMIRENHGGSIINTASMAGHIVNQAPMYQTLDDSSYGVSKAGVLYFTRHFASQVIKYGIRVNSVSPGYCYSPGLHDGLSQEILDCYVKTQPAMRMADVEELQGAVLFLASEASSYMVGQDILIDGGHTIW